MPVEQGPAPKRISIFWTFGRWELSFNPARWIFGVEHYLAEWRVFLPCFVLAYRRWMR